MTLDSSTIMLLVGTIIPILVGIVSKEVSSSKMKASLNLALSSIAGALTAALTAEGGIDANILIHGAIQTLVVSVSSYYGFWKPTQIASTVQGATRDIGI